MTNMGNNELRKALIEKRKGLSLQYRLEAADIIFIKLIQMDEYICADKVLLYADANGEVATDKLILFSLLEGKRVFAPVCGEDFSMEFYEIFAIDELYPGSYGIREPLPIDSLRLTESVIDEKTIIIVPGIAFDSRNSRIGYGRGFYDRYLGRNRITNRIALAYDFQIVELLETNDTDIPMTKIITN